MRFGISTFTPPETCKEISSLQAKGFPAESGFNANPGNISKITLFSIYISNEICLTVT